jgi:hypothetical protein
VPQENPRRYDLADLAPEIGNQVIQLRVFYTELLITHVNTSQIMIVPITSPTESNRAFPDVPMRRKPLFCLGPPPCRALTLLLLLLPLLPPLPHFCDASSARIPRLVCGEWCRTADRAG